MNQTDIRFQYTRLVSTKYGLLRTYSGRVPETFVLQHDIVVGRKGVMRDNAGDAKPVDLADGTPLVYEDLCDKASRFDLPDLSNLDLSDLDFMGADLSNVNFSGADLTNADFRCADLGRSDFTGANLTNANFMGAKLINTNFTGANLTGAQLYDERGFTPNGIHGNGTAYDKQGFDINKVHKNGTRYDDQGFDLDGYNAQGYDRAGYDRNGVDAQGYDRNGYGRDGFNNFGYTREGYAKDGIRYRVIRRNAPVSNRYEDDANAVAVQKHLERFGIPREKVCGYFFTDNTILHVVYAGDTPNVDKVFKADLEEEDVINTSIQAFRLIY